MSAIKKTDLILDDVEYGLEKILHNAIEYNKICRGFCDMAKHNDAKYYADLRDAYLNSYYLITGINIDYGDLPLN